MGDCRLCAGAVEPAFEKTVLGRHRVTYLRCLACGSLQTERPYWLTEAYQSALAGSDTGAVYRSLTCQAAVVVIARALRLNGAFLDYGGGAGLLCRLLRDSGLDAYTSDKYADPVYAQAFAIDPERLASKPIALISAIEVLEHCAEPAAEIGRLFAAHPQALFATTVAYRGQGEDWWYLGATSGQHVFFYSPKALKLLAERHGYDYFGVDSFHVYSRANLGLWQRAALKTGLSKFGLRGMAVWLAATRRARFVTADFHATCGQGLHEWGGGDGTEDRSHRATFTSRSSREDET
jgi:hypothetical protein